MNANGIEVEGNLTRDVDIKFTNTGKQICNFSIAYEHTNKYVSFFDIETWEDVAKKCEQLKKGEQVRVLGYLKQDRWPGQGGKPRSKIKIVGTDIDIVRKNNNSPEPEEYNEKTGEYDDQPPF